jgi:hypothetical protein
MEGRRCTARQATGTWRRSIKALVLLGAQLNAQTAQGLTPLQLSIHHGHHQAAQVLSELERTARARKAAATIERAQQAERMAAEHAERIAAELIEEEERDEAAKAQSKVRGVELAPVRGVCDAVSLAHRWVASSEVPAVAFL